MRSNRQMKTSGATCPNENSTGDPSLLQTLARCCEWERSNYISVSVHQGCEALDAQVVQRSAQSHRSRVMVGADEVAIGIPGHLERLLEILHRPCIGPYADGWTLLRWRSCIVDL